MARTHVVTASFPMSDEPFRNPFRGGFHMPLNLFVENKAGPVFQKQMILERRGSETRVARFLFRGQSTARFEP
jgi:hypothetical protein